MKKSISFIFGVLFGCILILGFTANANAGGWQFFDFNWRFERVKINTFNGVVDGFVSTWKDYEDSDVVQVTTEDGNVYLTSYNNVVLIHESQKN